MFSYSESVSKSARQCDKMTFLRIVEDKDGSLASICKSVQMHKESAQRSREAGDEAGARKMLDTAAFMKKKLPIFCFQATFRFGRRTIQNAQPNGLVMCDFDNIDDLPGFLLKLPARIGTWKEAGVVLAHFTPSMHGLRIVLKGDPGLTYVENQHAFASKIGLPLDEACKDLARCSFAVPKTYILFMDDELFTFNQPLKDQKNGKRPETLAVAAHDGAAAAGTDCRGAESSETSLRTPVESGSETPVEWERTDGKLSFKGIPFETIIAKWWELTGGEPVEGERNTKLHRLATNLRYICDGRTDILLKVIPRFGLSESEVRNLIQSACEPRLMWTMPKTMAAVLAAVAPKGASSLVTSRGVVGSIREGEYMPKEENAVWLERLGSISLPPGLKESVESVAIENRVNALIACLPVVYTAATGISYKIWDGQWYRLSGTSVLIGAAASGKSFCKDIVKAWLSPIKMNDSANRKIENDYKRNREASGTKGMKSVRPDVCIRQLPATASLATLNERSANAKRTVWNVPHTKEYTQHIHLVTVEYEFATVVKSLKQNFSSYLDFLIKSHQDEEVGVDYRNDASANGIRNIHWNQLYAGNMMDFKRLIPDSSVLNGMPLRLMIGFIPDNSYDMNVQTGFLSAHRRSVILDVAFKLDALTGNVDVSPLSNRMFEWSKRRAAESKEKGDKIADYIRRRCGSTIGMRAGVISAVIRNLKEWEKLPVVVLNNEKNIEENDKEFARQLKFVEDDFKFAEFIADYCFNQQYKLFKRPIEKAFQDCEILSEAVDMKNYRDSTLQNFERLPKEFTAKDVQEIFSVSYTSAKSYCSNWKREGKITFNKTTKNYQKN